ncbi:MAG: hypothetical protein E6P95_03775 [Candidatus Moraniibacteriota bacterium]|nr:MAG: hypothetical protein E6P95_03775 [Candidatus Moranbacteria bacterium]
MLNSERSNLYRSSFKRQILPLVKIGLASEAIWVASLFVLGNEAIPLTAGIAGAVYVIGTIADLRTTSEAIKLGATELNPLLSERPNDEELFSKKQLILDSTFLFLGMALPPIGFTVGMHRIKLALNNSRQITAFLSEK